MISTPSYHLEIPIEIRDGLSVLVTGHAYAYGDDWWRDGPYFHLLCGGIREPIREVSGLLLVMDEVAATSAEQARRHVDDMARVEAAERYEDERNAA